MGNLISFAKQRTKALIRRGLRQEAVAAEEASPNYVACYPLQNCPGSVYIYQRGDKYELAVATDESDYVTPLFFLKGYHVKLERAEERAIQVAKEWGKG